MPLPRRHNIVPFSRDYRRAPRLNMGLPSGRPPRRRRAPAGWLLRAVLILAFSLGIIPPLIDAANGFVKQTEGCRVLTVIDGDTVRILCPAQGMTAARLTGFDTPEITSPSCVSEFRDGVIATFLLRWKLWRAGRITAVPQGVDRYGRALVTLRLDGLDVAPAMIATDYAHRYGGGQRGGWCGF
jgi:micrococcal nuclease